jgi:hypothetical protein
MAVYVLLLLAMGCWVSGCWLRWSVGYLVLVLAILSGAWYGLGYMV